MGMEMPKDFSKKNSALENQDLPKQDGISRRELLKKGALFGLVSAMGVHALSGIMENKKSVEDMDSVAGIAKEKIDSISKNLGKMKDELVKMNIDNEALEKINSSIKDWELELSVLKEESEKPKPMSIMLSKLEELDKNVGLEKFALENGTHLGA